MKKRIRLIALLAVILLLAAAWTWRYVTLNRYYDDLDNGDYRLYQTGELVPFEDDGNDLYTDLNGYSIRVDKYEIRDYKAYLADAQLEVSREGADPDKLVLVYITLVNESCDLDPVALTDLSLRGVDTLISMDRDVLTAANPALGGYTSIALEAGTECQLVLPYMLWERNFGGSTWRNLDDYELYLQVTSALTLKEIVVNG